MRRLSVVQAVLSRTGFENQTIGEAHLATQSDNATLVAQSDRALTFSGLSGVDIPPEAEVVSDPVDLNVDPSHNLAVSLYLPGPTGPITWHATARQTLYLADGNQAGDTSGAAYDARTSVPAWYVIDGVEVRATSADQAAIVTFGDSITDGTNSSQDANHRWPDYLARKLGARSGKELSVIRTSGEFDGTIDFDAATRDAANPLAFRADFDRGDHLHPNDPGYSAMADAIDLNLFSP